MKINVMQLSDRGTIYSYSCSRDSCVPESLWVIEAIEEALDGKIVSGNLEIELTRIHQRVEVGLRFSISGTCVCTRCDQEIDISYAANENLFYDPLEETEPLEAEITLEDLDIGWYEEGKLDIYTVICEAFVLSLPDRIHCESAIVTRKTEGGCYTSPVPEDRTLENMFANILKIE